jgi:hypothetical protein
MRSEDKRSPAVERDKSQLGIEMESVAEVANGGKRHRENSHATRGTRKDKGGLHTTRHAVLSRFPLQALARLGENTRQLRKMERKLRAELKPSGPLAEMLFDRMWSSYLRCVLAAKAEAHAFTLVDQEDPGPSGGTPLMVAEALPTLVWPQDEITAENLQRLPADLFRQLALTQRYDSNYSREMFRSLGLLLVIKDAGEAGLTRCIGKSLGLNRESPER